MEAKLDLTWTGPRRHAFLFRPNVVRALLPPGHPGVYLLLDRDAPVYIGRSDVCVRERLANHEQVYRATHFTWHPSPNLPFGFYLESAEFHRLQGSPGLLNQVHPAHPEGLPLKCPFCEERDVKALSLVFGKEKELVVNVQQLNHPGLLVDVDPGKSLVPKETDKGVSPQEGRGGRASFRPTPDHREEETP